MLMMAKWNDSQVFGDRSSCDGTNPPREILLLASCRCLLERERERTVKSGWMFFAGVCCADLTWFGLVWFGLVWFGLFLLMPRYSLTSVRSIGPRKNQNEWRFY